MIPCERYACFTLVRDASFFTLAAVVLMIAFSFQPPLAFEIGATVALIFSISLLIRGLLLTPERFQRSEVWRGLHPEDRPRGEYGAQIAREYTYELMLRFAKSSSAVAGVLYASALFLSLAGVRDGSL